MLVVNNSRSFLSFFLVVAVFLGRFFIRALFLILILLQAPSTNPLPPPFSALTAKF